MESQSNLKITMKSNKALAGYQAAGSRPYKKNTAGRGAGPNGIDPGFSPLSSIGRAKGGGKSVPIPPVGYSEAGM